MTTTFPASKQTLPDPVTGPPASSMGSSGPAQHSILHQTTSDTLEAMQDAFLPTVNAQVGTTYTFVLADAFRPVTCTNASAITVTVPANSTVPYAIGTTLELWQGGAGLVTLVADGGVTIKYHADLTLSLLGLDAGCSLRKTGTDEWRLIGMMDPA